MTRTAATTRCKPNAVLGIPFPDTTHTTLHRLNSAASSIGVPAPEKADIQLYTPVLCLGTDHLGDRPASLLGLRLSFHSAHHHCTIPFLVHGPHLFVHYRSSLLFAFGRGTASFLHIYVYVSVHVSEKSTRAKRTDMYINRTALSRMGHNLGMIG